MAHEKPIEQLLLLSRNPFYILTEAEKKRLDTFLSENPEKAPKKSQKKNSKQSDKQTPVRVKNVVETTQDTPERTSNES